MDEAGELLSEQTRHLQSQREITVVRDPYSQGEQSLNQQISHAKRMQEPSLDLSSRVSLMSRGPYSDCELACRCGTGCLQIEQPTGVAVSGNEHHALVI